MTRNQLLQLFQGKSQEQLYKELLRLADDLPVFQLDWKTEENRVLGCQSLMYLHAELKEGRLHFAAFSDALISKGLAALLINFYEGMEPKEFLMTPPTFLKDLGILTSLSPTRVNGVASLWSKMKQETVRLALLH
ncbi:MAG: SufE family protein [Verrucomicrobia bacterium]|nr:SufE family protein [Verrucomicrobiota bacterium]MBS0645592.1 SufE family protein [Verrucomicrobiota bacterium]